MTNYLTDSNGDLIEVPEETAVGIDYSLTDESGGPATLTALAYSLTDEAGNVINNLDDKPLATAASGTVALSGADLALTSQASVYEWRILTLKGTYNSTLGNDLTLIEETWFKVVNAKVIT